MKQVSKYILVGLSLLALSVSGFAQYNTENNVATSKNVGPMDSNGNYTITLETFARGEETVVESAAPADIVLVLDLSQSMTDTYGGYVYTQRDQQGYSYNDMPNSNSANNAYYYLHTDGNYYQVTRRTGSSGGVWNQTTYYRLSVDINNTRYYLPDLTTTAPTNITNANTTIWPGVFYTRAQGTRLSALQKAVSDFVEVIYHNDNYEDKTNDHPRTNQQGDRITLGNRISIVTFGGPQGNTNVTRVNSMTNNDYATALHYVTNADGTKNEDMISELMALTTGTNTDNTINNADHYGTYSDEGMVLANNVLNAIDATRKANSSRTVVLFTDGAPGSGPGWTTGNGDTASTATANRCIAAALTAKTTHTATVFTVVIGSTDTNMNNYLDYTSSNYPAAASMTSPGTASTSDTDYSLAPGNDLSGAFTTIAHASGGYSGPVNASTQVRDVVSSSFVIPNDFTVNDVVIKVYKIVSEDEWTEDTTYDKSGITAVIGTNDAGNSMLTVEGFDYGKADDPDGSGNGNWVGERLINGSWIWKGRKLVIQFKIKSTNNSTGGDGTNTNTAESGVYVKDDNGNYVCLTHYEMPHTSIPMNLVIRKTGLKHGESATFEIERCRPLHWDESKTLAENLANLEYNAIGKPKPNNNWEDWSKVIITNKGADRVAVTKTLLSLDPHYIYRVVEDNWGWAYTVTGNTGSDIPNTSTVEVNPFTFTNEDKVGAVKHAEAVTINHFGYTDSNNVTHDSREEHYKSSKTN